MSARIEIAHAIYARIEYRFRMIFHGGTDRRRTLRPLSARATTCPQPIHTAVLLIIAAPAGLRNQVRAHRNAMSAKIRRSPLSLSSRSPTIRLLPQSTITPSFP